MTLVKRLADFSVNLSFEHIPEVVVHEVKRSLLDCIGCAVGAINVDKGQIALDWSKKAGGNGEAAILGTGLRVPPMVACAVNGELMQALDYEVCLSPGHVSPYVIPATLALAEVQGSSGQEIIVALAIAHDISVRFGKALSHIRDVVDGKVVWPQIAGFSCNVFGGTLAACKILGMDPEKTSHALGIAGYIAPVQSTTKWMLTTPLASTKHLMAGSINLAEYTAATFAQLGYKGDIEVLEGDYGFWRYIGSRKWNPDAITDKLGADWLMPGLSFYKPYPCGGVFDGCLDCFIGIIEENSLTPQEIEKVAVFIGGYIAPDTHTAPLPVFKNRKIITSVDAQMSGPYIFAVAAHRIPIGPDWLTAETMNNPEIRGFMDRVDVLAHPEWGQALEKEPNARMSKAEVKARGRTFTKELKYRKGSPMLEATKMTDAELVSKFKHNMDRVLPSDKIDQASKQIMALEDVKSWCEVIRNLTK